MSQQYNYNPNQIQQNSFIEQRNMNLPQPSWIQQPQTATPGVFQQLSKMNSQPQFVPQNIPQGVSQGSVQSQGWNNYHKPPNNMYFPHSGQSESQYNPAIPNGFQSNSPYDLQRQFETLYQTQVQPQVQQTHQPSQFVPQMNVQMNAQMTKVLCNYCGTQRARPTDVCPKCTKITPTYVSSSTDQDKYNEYNEEDHTDYSFSSINYNKGGDAFISNKSNQISNDNYCEYESCQYNYEGQST